jgi:hypothetical protein
VGKQLFKTDRNVGRAVEALQEAIPGRIVQLERNHGLTYNDVIVGREQRSPAGASGR